MEPWGEGEGGTADAHFGGGEGLCWIDGGVSISSGQETGNEAGVRHHMGGGATKGVSE